MRAECEDSHYIKPWACRSPFCAQRAFFCLQLSVVRAQSGYHPLQIVLKQSVWDFQGWRPSSVRWPGMRCIQCTQNKSLKRRLILSTGYPRVWDAGRHQFFHSTPKSDMLQCHACCLFTCSTGPMAKGDSPSLWLHETQKSVVLAHLCCNITLLTYLPMHMECNCYRLLHHILKSLFKQICFTKLVICQLLTWWAAGLIVSHLIHEK